MMVTGKVAEQDLLQIVITDLGTKQQQLVLVGWKEGGLGDIAYRIYNSLNEDEDSGVMETYFWLFWRAWAGVLDPGVVESLPNADQEVLELVRGGRPLRREHLRRFKTTIVWAFANAVTEWGDTDAWKTGELSPGHLGLRDAMHDYIDRRMIMLHGENYENAPSE